MSGEQSKPEGYPFVTLQRSHDGYLPVLFDWHPAGFEQASDTLGDPIEFEDARRAGMIWAKRLGCAYKPVIGEM